MYSILPRAIPIALLAVSALLLITCASRSGRSVALAADQRALVQERNFVYVAEAVPGAIIDLRYALSSNVAKRRLYPVDMPCLLHRDTATKLLKVQRYLEQRGYGLKIWDAWRPPSSHMALWYSNPNPDYLTPPENGLSYHCLGVAVDVTLVDGRGFELPMPSKFDEFSPKAWSNYRGGDPEISRHVSLLQTAMKKAGFVGIESEWWHWVDPRARDVRAVFAAEFDIKLPVRTVKVSRR